MSIATDTPVDAQMIELSEIRSDQNVRQELNVDGVEQLAQSIALLGQLTAISVRRADDGGYVLIAGHKRCAALTQLGHSTVRAEVPSDAENESAERAAENIVRTQLNPYEEAVAVRAMFDRGLTADGVAQALGWSRSRVTARVRLLELPDTAQQMVGSGAIPLSAIETLLRIGQISPPLLDAVVAFLAAGNEWAADRLAREPGWVLDSALRATNTDVFAEHLATVSSRGLAELKLGKRAAANLERIEELTTQLDRYGYGARISFAESEIDQARAAQVVVEFDSPGSIPVITDRALYRELCRQAVTRTVGELEAAIGRRAEDRKADRQAARESGETVDPVRDADRDHRRRIRELAEDGRKRRARERVRHRCPRRPRSSPNRAG